jgi:hypothetical protein
MPAWLLLLVVPHATPETTLAPGKFGKALDASRTPLAFAGDRRYRTPPLTVECWAKFNSKRAFNVLVSCDEKRSARHWELYTYAGSGALAVFLPGYEPSEIVSKGNVCDKKWHHFAFTFDAKSVSLFRDGKPVLTKTVKPRPGVKPLDGPLSIGMAIDGSARVGCDGLIDDVRISRVIRPIKEAPTKPHPVDADTIAGWRFDGDDRVLADPEWTPPPAALGEPWERWSDPDWVDARFRKMDTGLALNATMKYPHGKASVIVPKALAIKVGDGGVIFDRATLRLSAAWTGGWLNHSDRRFGLLNTPEPAGKMVFSAPPGAGWADKDGKFPAVAGTAPIEWGRFNGLYTHGKRAVLSYTVHGVAVLDSPWVDRVGKNAILTRALEVGPSKKPLTLFVKRGDGLGYLQNVQPAGACKEVESGGETRIVLPPSDKKRRLLLAYTHVGGSFLPIPAGLIPMPDLAALIKPGPRRWKDLVTKGELSKDTTSPYVVDTLTIPYENPYKALFFCTGLDFLPDGRIAVCTCHGDVWLVSFDEKLEKITWRRYATGLYHPLGLKVIDGKIVVLERGQLTRLHGKEEAHFYENVCNLWHTGSGEHSYDTCLETDAKGNFYFFKTGDTHLPHGGCLLRVPADGKKVEIFATGFRHPIGLGISPDGMITGADQEGNWMPKTRVDVYRKGGFYGDMRAHHRATPPKTFDPPLLWLPKNIDNSAGGQAWVANDKFGWPKGQMLHFSYGRCKVYAVLPQKVGDVMQAGAVDLGVKFLSGSARGRFSPKDGHLYVVGLNGWQTAAQRDGCLQRMRYTGKPLPVAVGLEACEDGVKVRFARPLDKKSADPKKWKVEQWGYRYSGNYGSRDWSVRHPEREGIDHLKVTAVTLEEGGKVARLKVEDMRPAMQMRVGHDILFADGKKALGAIYSTVHALAKSR